MQLTCIMCVYMIVIHAVLGNPVVRPSQEQNDVRTVASTSQLSLLSVSRWSFGTRTKRENAEDEIEILPTRHAKHRRRRRCKNRPACLRFTTSSTQVLEESLITSLDAANDKTNDHSKTQQDSDYENEDNVGLRFPLENRTEGTNVPTRIRLNYEGVNVTNSEDIHTYSDSEYLESRDNDTMGDYVDSTDTSSIYLPPNDQTVIHDSLTALLTRLFQNLRNVSAEDSREILKELNFVENVNEDPCQKWLNSKDKLEEAFLGPLTALPACPCQYPSNIFYDDKIWDEAQGKHFRWRDVSGGSQRLDVYKPGAAYCVRSLLTQGSGSAAAQHCCYDRQRRLITRGSGAGTPNFVSPEISATLHEKIDVLPWRLCKGDFSRYNKVRPPNNGNGCDDNPDDDEYQRQINNTKYY